MSLCFRHAAKSVLIRVCQQSLTKMQHEVSHQHKTKNCYHRKREQKSWMEEKQVPCTRKDELQEFILEAD